MALLANSVRLAALTNLGGNGATSGSYTAERNVHLSPGQRKTFAYGEARIADVTNRAAVPEGYVHPYCHSMPQKGGGMTSRGRIVGAGGLTSQLAGGIDALAALVGSGSISAASLQLIVNALADLSGSGDLAAAITGKLEAAAALVGSGDLDAALGAIADIVASLSGAGTAAGTSTALGHMSINITAAGEALSTANIGDAVFNAICEAGFSYGDVVRILAAVAAGKTTIVDNGGGTATVTFRDVSDTKDRVVADMDGSERVSITLDGE